MSQIEITALVLVIMLILPLIYNYIFPRFEDYDNIFQRWLDGVTSIILILSWIAAIGIIVFMIYEAVGIAII
jgi:succinate dehydrogenase hydrophobic anchor subunit